MVVMTPWQLTTYEKKIDLWDCSVTLRGTLWWAKVGRRVVGGFVDAESAMEACERCASGTFAYSKVKTLRGWVA
jgi:hypothetical protein